MSKKVAAPGVSNGVWVRDKFYPNGSTLPEGTKVTNDRVYAGGGKDADVDPQVATVVGAPTPEQVAEAERQAAALAGAGADTGAAADDGGNASPKPAKKATAKKATAKRASTSS